MTWLGDHWLDLFGWFGSALLIFSLLQTRVLRFRLLNLAASLSLVVFNALVGVWPMVGMNLATSSINLWFIARMLRERHDETAFDVLQVGPTDAYLRHFLAVHETDIGRHQPGFDADDLQRRRTSPSRWRRATRPSASYSSGGTATSPGSCSTT